MTVNRQKGAALVVGMIVLLVLTILGLASVSSMTSELKIASNLQDYNSAFQAASAGITEAENDNTINWLVIDSNITQTVNYAAADSSSSAVANVVYSDCRKVTFGSSLKMGAAWKGLVHEIRSTGVALNSLGNPVSSNTQVLGIQTIRPGC